MQRCRMVVALAGAAFAVLGGGCASPDEVPVGDGDPAVWELYDAESVTSETTILNIGVTRVACNSGVTGHVLEPKVSYELTRILIETDVEPQHPDAATCQGNDYVRVRVELTEPIGKRDLVDAGCLDEEAARASFCLPHVRWKGR